MMKSLTLILATVVAYSSANPLPNDNVEVADFDPVGEPNDVCTSVKILQMPFSFGPTQTVYTTTSTTSSTVDCDGCAQVRPTYLVLGVPPAPVFTATTTVNEPSLVTEYVCDPSATAAEKRDYGNGIMTITPRGVRKPKCTSQAAVEPSVSDSTSTVYPRTKTVTSDISCGRCAVEWSTQQIYYFAPIIITATISVQTPSTKVVLACATN